MLSFSPSHLQHLCGENERVGLDAAHCVLPLPREGDVAQSEHGGEECGEGALLHQREAQHIELQFHTLPCRLVVDAWGPGAREGRGGAGVLRW